MILKEQFLIGILRPFFLSCLVRIFSGFCALTFSLHVNSAEEVCINLGGVSMCSLYLNIFFLLLVGFCMLGLHKKLTKKNFFFFSYVFPNAFRLVWLHAQFVDKSVHKLIAIPSLQLTWWFWKPYCDFRWSWGTINFARVFLKLGEVVDWIVLSLVQWTPKEGHKPRMTHLQPSPLIA